MPTEPTASEKSLMARRFRGFLPVVVDVETGGFNARTDAILEIAATILRFDDNEHLVIEQTHSYQVDPFENANLDPSALEFTGIDPADPSREAMPEDLVFDELFQHIRKAVKTNGCTRAILVGHNAHFDQGFVNAAANRCRLKRNPFHPFSCFDTATLAGLALGQTVLARACQVAGLGFDNKEAHSAEYDTIKTAELFCMIVNRWKDLGGWDLATAAIADNPDTDD